MTLTAFHGRLATTVLLYVFALAVWGFIRFFLKRGVEGNYWGALVIAEIVILIQGAIGVYLWIIGARPGETIHLLYGAISAIAIPSTFGFTRGRDTRRDMLIYAAVLLFLAGIGLRAIDTGL